MSQRTTTASALTGSALMFLFLAASCGQAPPRQPANETAAEAILTPLGDSQSLLPNEHPPRRHPVGDQRMQAAARPIHPNPQADGAACGTRLRRIIDLRQDLNTHEDWRNVAETAAWQRFTHAYNTYDNRCQQQASTPNDTQAQGACTALWEDLRNRMETVENLPPWADVLSHDRMAPLLDAWRDALHHGCLVT